MRHRQTKENQQNENVIAWVVFYILKWIIFFFLSFPSKHTLWLLLCCGMNEPHELEHLLMERGLICAESA